MNTHVQLLLPTIVPCVALYVLSTVVLFFNPSSAGAPLREMTAASIQIDTVCLFVGLVVSMALGMLLGLSAPLMRFGGVVVYSLLLVSVYSQTGCGKRLRERRRNTVAHHSRIAETVIAAVAFAAAACAPLGPGIGVSQTVAHSSCAALLGILGSCVVLAFWDEYAWISPLTTPVGCGC